MFNMGFLYTLVVKLCLKYFPIWQLSLLPNFSRILDFFEVDIEVLPLLTLKNGVSCVAHYNLKKASSRRDVNNGTVLSLGIGIFVFLILLLDDGRHLFCFFVFVLSLVRISVLLRTWYRIRFFVCVNITSTVFRMWLYCWAVSQGGKAFESGSHASSSGVAFLCSPHFFTST